MSGSMVEREVMIVTDPQVVAPGSSTLIGVGLENSITGARGIGGVEPMAGAMALGGSSAPIGTGTRPKSRPFPIPILRPA